MPEQDEATRPWTGAILVRLRQSLEHMTCDWACWRHGCQQLLFRVVPAKRELHEPELGEDVYAGNTKTP